MTPVDAPPSPSDDALLETLLASIAGDVAGVRCLDRTRDRCAESWLRAHRARTDEAPVDLLVCDLGDLSRVGDLVVDGGLVLAHVREGEVAPTSADLLPRATVRDDDGAWWLYLHAPDVGEPDPAILTILVTCQDQASDLARLFTMLAADEGHIPWELVVIDRSSFDQTGALLRAVEGDLRIRHVPRGTSPAQALDLGFSIARGEAVLVLDPSFIPSPGFVRSAAAALREHPTRSLVAGRLVDGATDRLLTVEVGDGPLTLGVAPGLFCLRTQAWRAAGPFEPDPAKFLCRLADAEGGAVVEGGLVARYPVEWRKRWTG